MGSITMATAPPEPSSPNVTAFLTGDRPRIIAHRGFSGLFPENTMIAFRKALEGGAEMIELDVLLSRDGELIVLHDAELDRTTDGSGLAAEHDAAALRSLDAGQWFAPEFAGEQLPTLEEVLELVRGRALLNVEIKEEAVTESIAGGVVEKTINAIHAAGMTDAVLLSSFEPRALFQAREIDPALARATLFNAEVHGDQTPTQILEAAGSCSFNLGRDEVTSDIVRACHDRGAVVLVYTVNDGTEMERLFDLGVDGVFTDRMDVGFEVLDRL